MRIAFKLSFSSLASPLSFSSPLSILFSSFYSLLLFLFSSPLSILLSSFYSLILFLFSYPLSILFLLFSSFCSLLLSASLLLFSSFPHFLLSPFLAPFFSLPSFSLPSPFLLLSFSFPSFLLLFYPSLFQARITKMSKRIVLMLSKISRDGRTYLPNLSCKCIVITWQQETRNSCMICGGL
jgi:hypothetical protein